MDKLELFNLANEKYYDGEPILTDLEYDKLKKEIESSANRDNVINTVGTGSKNSKVKITHYTPMFSMKDVFAVQEAIDWMNKILDLYSHVTFSIEFKYDGMSCTVTYIDGELTYAAKRGDGLVGEDITKHIRLVDTIPKSIGITGTIELKGELVIPVKVFKDVNESVSTTYSNPRSMVAGTLNSDDVDLMVLRGVEFYPWTITGLHHTTELDKYKFIEDMSLRTLPPVINISANNVEDIYNKAIDDRDNLPITIDGIVIRVNEIDIQEELSNTGKYPNWLIALKLPAFEKVTRLLDIKVDIGRTGVYTPVGIIEPVEIDGTIVTNVTLNNYTDISNKGIMIGDYGVLIKSGDIIPKLIKVFKERRDGTEMEIIEPTVCMYCNSILVKPGNLLKCYNNKCGGRVIATISFFAGREQMNIESFGPSTIKKLYDKEYIKVPGDIFKITKDMLLDIGKSEPYSEILLSNIDKASHTTFSKVISSLGIPLVGKTVSTKLYDAYGEDFITMSVDELSKVHTIGKETATSLHSYMTDSLLDVKDLISNMSIEKKKTGKLDNLTFVITGSFDGISRVDISKDIVSNGGKVSNSISTSTSYLVAGIGGGSKLNTAKDKKVKVISLDELNRLKD